MENQRGGKRKGAGRKKEFKDRGNFMGYNYEKDEVIRKYDYLIKKSKI